MTTERLNNQLEEMRIVIRRLRKAAEDTQLSQAERDQIAAELRAIQEQIRKISKSM